MTGLSFILDASGVNRLKYFKIVYVWFHSCTSVYVRLISITCQGEKVETVNCIATLILVEMGRYVKIWTYYKNLLQCEIPGLSVEW